MRRPRNVWELVAAIKQCTKALDLEGGKSLHQGATEAGLYADKYVASALITMYSKCRSIGLAQEVFEGTTHRDVALWNSLMMGYVETGKSLMALDLYTQLDCEPDRYTFVAAIKACASLAAERNSDKQLCMEKGREIHKIAKERGLESIMVANILVDMYSKCGCMSHAREVFNGIPGKDVVSWTSLILGYVRNGEHSTALELFMRMDCEPNSVTFVAVLKACGGLAMENESKRQFCLQKGMEIHKQVKELGLEANTVVGNALLDMYRKVGDMQSALVVFHGMSHRTVVSWTSLILGYVDNRESSLALDLFSRMDCEPDPVAFVAALKACSSLATEDVSRRQWSLEKGMAIHERLKASGLVSSLILMNTLLDMYSKCGNMNYARKTFERMTNRDVVSWNCILLGYVENGESSNALEMFTSMDFQPDSVTYVAALKACASVATERSSQKPFYLEKGKTIHQRLREAGLESNSNVATTLLDMYNKCGSMRDAQAVFDSMNHPDVVAWTCLLVGYVENGESSKAVELFLRMDCEPDRDTFVAVLKACGILATLSAGQRAHAWICKLGVEGDELIGTALVDFYGKCGCMRVAEQVFNGMQSRNIFSWTSLMAGYTGLGNTARVFGVVAEIEEAGLQMDSITFVCILTACSHAGMVEEGKIYFESMSMRYGVSPSLEHYNCVVDMLVRANRVEEALAVAKNIPFQLSEVTRMTIQHARLKE